MMLLKYISDFLHSKNDRDTKIKILTNFLEYILSMDPSFYM